MKPIEGQPFFCSWSGGKDSSLALHRAVCGGGRPRFLLTMLAEGGERSKSHWLPTGVIEKQAQALGIPTVVRAASWDDYEAAFISALHEIKGNGVGAGVFGDIDIEEHREWVERVCRTAGIEAHEPLWKGERRALLEEFVRAGFKATIVVVKEDALDKGFLGREIDARTIADLEAAGVDPSGERGEYHTAVTDGPIFSKAVRLEVKGEVAREGYRFLDVRAG